jgi:hypothetical protein
MNLHSLIKSHSSIISIPQSKEIVPPDTLKLRLNIVEDWFATARVIYFQSNNSGMETRSMSHPNEIGQSILNTEGMTMQRTAME